MSTQFYLSNGDLGSRKRSSYILFCSFASFPLSISHHISDNVHCRFTNLVSSIPRMGGLFKWTPMITCSPSSVTPPYHFSSWTKPFSRCRQETCIHHICSIVLKRPPPCHGSHEKFSAISYTKLGFRYLLNVTIVSLIGRFHVFLLHLVV
jgi:hypothetical protein